MLNVKMLNVKMLNVKCRSLPAKWDKDRLYYYWLLQHITEVISSRHNSRHFHICNCEEGTMKGTRYQVLGTSICTILRRENDDSYQVRVKTKRK